MPAVYDKMGIRFLFPDNWTLDEEDVLRGQTSVTVYSPEGGFWSIVMHPPGMPLEELMQAVLKVLRETYQDFEAEPITETVEGQELKGYDLNFFCLDLTNTGHIRTFHTPDATCLVLCQAEDREYPKVEPVFRAITTSLVRDL